MFKNILRVGISQFLGLAITFLIGVIISRVYGPEGKGLLTLLILIPTLISTYAGMSIEEGFLYHIGKKEISRAIFNRLLTESFLIFIPFFGLIYLIVFSFVDSYPYYFLPQALLMAGLLYSSILKFALRGAMNFKRYNLIQIVEPTVVLLGLGLVLWLDSGPQFILWAYVASYFVSIFLQFLAISQGLPNSNVSKISLKNIFDYSYKVHFFKILNYTEGKFDILLLGFLSTVSSVGIYSISLSLAALFQALVQSPISNVLYPTLIKLDKNSQIKTTQQYFKLSYFLSLIFMAGMIILGHGFIVKVYGIGFSSAYWPLLILVIGAVPRASAACLNSYFKATGKPQELYKTSVYTVSLNIILCILLIPNYDMIGAAVASGISYFLFTIIMLIKFIKSSGVSLKSFLPSSADGKKIINIIKGITVKS